MAYDKTKGKNICIIGSGIGGLTAGALLTKKGHNVKIFEKESFLGGRGASFTLSNISLKEYKDLLSRFNMGMAFSQPDLKTIFENRMLDGYKLDLGFHTIGGAGFNIIEIFTNLDKPIDVIDTHVGLIKENGFDIRFLHKVDKIKILPNIIRLLFSGEKTMKRLDSVSMKETINKYGKGKMKMVLELFSRTITTVNNLNLISTGEVFRAQKNLLKGSKSLGYPKGGFASITQQLAGYIKQNGGEIHLERPVDKIIIKDNKAVGILVDNNEYFFDVIVSNILVQDFFTLVDEKYFPKNYVKHIKSLKGTGSLCAYYSLKQIDSDLIGRTFLFIERNIGVNGDDAVGMIDFMVSSPDAGLSSSDKILVQSYIICTPEEARDEKILTTLRSILDKNLSKLAPDFQSKLNWAIYPAVWHLDGVAKILNNEKPEIKTSIDNLYIVGDCVKAPGVGFNCAINSAIDLITMI